MMKILYRSRDGAYRALSRSSRMLSTPVLEAASISRTSIDLPAAISWQDGHLLQGVIGRTFHAVQSLRQNSGRRGFAHAPRSRKQIGVTNAIDLDRILKGLDDRLLADNVLEKLRPEFSGDDLIFHSSDVAAVTKARPGGYCVTLDYPLPLLPSGPGGVFGLQLHSPPKPDNGPLNGESGIRTHGGVSPTHAFQACSFNHSDISPDSRPSDSITNILYFIRAIRTGRGCKSFPISRSCLIRPIVSTKCGLS